MYFYVFFFNHVCSETVVSMAMRPGRMVTVLSNMEESLLKIILNENEYGIKITLILLLSPSPCP